MISRVASVSSSTIVGQLEAEDACGVMQPDKVLLQSKNGGPSRCLVAANAFEDAEAIVQRVADQMNLGVVPTNDRAVRPDRSAVSTPLVPVPATRPCERQLAVLHISRHVQFFPASRSTMTLPPMATWRIRALSCRYADVLQRIAVDDQEIRQLAGLKAADSVVHLKQTGGVDASRRRSPPSALAPSRQGRRAHRDCCRDR